MEVPTWWCRNKKTPLPNLEEELMMEAWCLLKSEENEVFSPSHFSFDYKL